MPAFYTSLCRCLDVPLGDDQEPDLGKLKQALSQRGVNARGWRLCLDYGDDLILPLGGVWFRSGTKIGAKHAVAYLRLLQACETDIPPNKAFTASMVDWRVPDWDLTRIPVHFFRAAWKASVAADYAGQSDFIQRELAPLARWFFTTRQYTLLDDHLFKAGWTSIQRRWRQALISQNGLDPLSEWDPVIRWAETGAFRFLALDSEEALKAEGEAMSHCILSYADLCRMETRKAYSIRHRKTNARHATVMLREFEGNVWEIDQIKGPGNAEVTPFTLRETYALIRCMEDATRERAGLSQFMAELTEPDRVAHNYQPQLYGCTECFF
jgi:hypothetical protein